MKLVFSNLVDAILNRVGGIVSNMLLRRLAMHVAQSRGSRACLNRGATQDAKGIRPQRCRYAP